MNSMSIFKIFEFATSISFILAIVTVIISFAIFFILKRIRDNENKTNTLIGIVTDLTNEVRTYTLNSKTLSMGSGIAYDYNSMNNYDEENIDNINNGYDDESETNIQEDIESVDDDDDDDDDNDDNDDDDENNNDDDETDDDDEENNDDDEENNDDDDNDTTSDVLATIELSPNNEDIKVVAVNEDLDLANYLKMTVKELRGLVKEKKLHSDASKLRKKQLIELLEKQ